MNIVTLFLAGVTMAMWAPRKVGTKKKSRFLEVVEVFRLVKLFLYSFAEFEKI